MLTGRSLNEMRLPRARLTPPTEHDLISRRLKDLERRVLTVEQALQAQKVVRETGRRE